MSRTRFYLFGFGILAVFDTLTQISLKLAAQRAGSFAFELGWLHAAALAPWVYGAVAGYLGAFFTWMKLLEHAPVGPAFAASHVDVVTVLLISIPLFGERLGTAQIGGALCVVVGIVLLAISEPKEAPEGTPASPSSRG